METPDDPGQLSFGAAMEELETILRRVEGEEIDIDQLGDELGRAAELLEICRGKIRRAEVEVNQIVQALEEPEGSSPPEPAAASEPATEEAPTAGTLFDTEA